MPFYLSVSTFIGNEGETETPKDDTLNGGTVKGALGKKITSLMTEIDGETSNITSQEKEETIKQLESILGNLRSREMISDVLPPPANSPKRGRPASTKRLPSKFEIMEADAKKKAKTMSKM
jgi:hypothetical protein